MPTTFQEVLGTMSNHTTIDFKFNKGADVTYGLICLICVVIGAPGNAISLLYFLSKRKDISTIIYICLTAVDTLICLTALPSGLSYLSNREPLMFGNFTFCNIWIVCYRILSSLYIFYVALLSITRTFFLLLPFKSISTRLIKIIIVVHFVLQCILSTVMFWEEGGHYMYFNIFVDCSWPKDGITKFEQFYNIMSKITYTIPIFPIVISCVISIYALLFRNPSGGSRDDDKRYASVTIVMFTVVYCIFNIPASAVNLIGASKLDSFDTYSYFGNFLFGLSIPLHSLTNPILYIMRMRNLRTWVLGKFWCLGRKAAANDRMQMTKLDGTIMSEFPDDA